MTIFEELKAHQKDLFELNKKTILLRIRSACMSAVSKGDTSINFYLDKFDKLHAHLLVKILQDEGLGAIHQLKGFSDEHIQIWW